MEKKKIKRRIYYVFENILTAEATTLKANQMPSLKAAKWLQENQNILGAL